MSFVNKVAQFFGGLIAGHRIDMTSSQSAKIRPKIDDTGKLQIGDGTYDMDFEVYLGTSTEKAVFDVGNSRLSLDAIPLRYGGGGAVTQATSITTGVTLSNFTGQITTVSQTVAAAAEAEFTVTNTKVTATSVVAVCIGTHASTGTFTATVSAVASGSFDITLANHHASAAGNDTLVINFIVFEGSIA